MITPNQALKIINKMQKLIQKGRVVKNPWSFYETKDGERFYSFEEVTGSSCGCLIGLWNIAVGSEYYQEGITKYLEPFYPKISATAITAMGPKAMLKVLAKAEKALQTSLGNKGK